MNVGADSIRPHSRMYVFAEIQCEISEILPGD